MTSQQRKSLPRGQGFASRKLSAVLRALAFAALSTVLMPGLEAVANPETETTAHAGTLWSFQPPQRPAVPEIDGASVRTPVDAFVAAGLHAKGLTMSPRAGRRALLRRVTFDLTGLPPTPAEIADFVADESPDAFTKVVDRLLASAAYGERWGQHWFDVVRYADSDGFEYDDPRPHAWRYRDWVIDALVTDLPYDEFVQLQIAGDEIAPEDPAALTAVGVHRLGPLRLNGGMQDEAKNRQELLVEMTDMVGTAFLGLTIGCAKCHDHRFDPVSQDDYYRLQAFFAATQPRDISLAPPDVLAAHDAAMEVWQAENDRLTERLKELEEPFRERLMDVKRSALPVAMQRALEQPEGERTELEEQLAVEAATSLSITRLELADALTDDAAARHQRLVGLMDAHVLQRPTPPPALMSVTEGAPKAPATFVLVRGVPGDHGVQVGPGVPSSLSPPAQPPARLQPAPSGDSRSTGRRTWLSQWLTSPENPLTARVMVNRMWQHLFGAGLVTTPNDFGGHGAAPSHPELLDWLAVELVESGWSLKHLQRLLLLSSVYQQASVDRPAARDVDPENSLLWRARRKRLEAEPLRDAVLAVSGKLQRRRGGPGVRTPLGRELESQMYKGKWIPNADPRDHARRSVYLFVKRNLRPTIFTVFDAPDTVVSCGERSRSTHVGQALNLLNSEFIHNASRAFAARLLDEGNAGEAARWVERAYTLAFGRSPTVAERQASVEFLRRHTESLKNEKRHANAPLASAPNTFTTAPTTHPAAGPFDTEALADFCLVMFNLDEFVWIH